MNELAEQIAEMYISKRIGKNDVCMKCRAESDKKGNKHIGPIPMFHIGEDFYNDKLRMLIIGSVSYGWDEFADIKDNKLSTPNATRSIMKDVEQGIYEIFMDPKERYGRRISFLNMIKSICIEVFGSFEKAYPKVAITNVIKCNAGNVEGGAPTHMKSFCANSCNELMVTKQEIDILKPNVIIALAGSSGGNAYIESHWGIETEKILSFKRRGVSFDEYGKQTMRFLQALLA